MATVPWLIPVAGLNAECAGGQGAHVLAGGFVGRRVGKWVTGWTNGRAVYFADTASMRAINKGTNWSA